MPPVRRGPFQEGERVQLTDPKGRLHTITLTVGKQFHTHRGYLAHDDLIGAPDGSTIRNTAGVEYLAVRPLLADYVLSMPRGAAVVYPKDAGQIVAMADIFPGARVVEAGVGSGALSMSLLRAVGDEGMLHSFERREDFADIAQGNVAQLLRRPAPRVDRHGRRPRRVPAHGGRGRVDRPRRPGHARPVGVPRRRRRRADARRRPHLLRRDGHAAVPRRRGDPRPRRLHRAQAWESLVRGWHLEGLAVRPEHRMHGHTGFLITTRRLAPGVTPPLRKRRPAKGAYDDAADATPGANPAPGGDWSPEDVGERPLSEKKIRRVRRSVTGASLQEVPPAG